jgi:hypothetical protein
MCEIAGGSERVRMMKMDYRTVALAACAAVIVAAPIAYAQVATTLAIKG